MNLVDRAGNRFMRFGSFVLRGGRVEPNIVRWNEWELGGLDDIGLKKENTMLAALEIFQHRMEFLKRGKASVFDI